MAFWHVTTADGRRLSLRELRNQAQQHGRLPAFPGPQKSRRVPTGSARIVEPMTPLPRRGTERIGEGRGHGVPVTEAPCDRAVLVGGGDRDDPARGARVECEPCRSQVRPGLVARPPFLVHRGSLPTRAALAGPALALADQVGAARPPPVAVAGYRALPALRTSPSYALSSLSVICSTPMVSSPFCPDTAALAAENAGANRAQESGV